MARYLFLTWNGAGNQPPAIGIAQALRDRGHEVTFAGYENQRSLFTGRGFRFTLLEHSSAAWRDEPVEQMFSIKVNAAWASFDHLRDVPQVISEERCDVLVVDCLMFGALAVLERAGVPTGVLVHSAPGALLPPGGPFEACLLEPINRVREEAGRPALVTLWDAWKSFPAYCTSIRPMDRLASQAPASFHYVGPIDERAPLSGWRPPWSHDDERPLVLVSFSTGPYWDQISRIRKTIDALADRDCRILVTAGMTNRAAISVPSNVTVVRHVPHSEVLPLVSVTITHAGHGTVLASLTHGVPLLCLPNAAADQPALAAQVQTLGAGLALDGDNVAPAEIAAAMDRLLTVPSFAAAAQHLARTIAEAPGVGAVARQLERLATDGRAPSGSS